MYEIIFTEKASNFAKKLPKANKRKLKEILEKLKENPFSYPYRKIKGESNLYRIRIGTYRILYEVNEKEKKVTVLKIEKRSKAYRNLLLS